MRMCACMCVCVRMCVCTHACFAGSSVYEAVEARDHAECLSQLSLSYLLRQSLLKNLELTNPASLAAASPRDQCVSTPQHRDYRRVPRHSRLSYSF